MTYRTVYDAEFPPDSPPDTDGVLVYAGGAASHAWTDAEINAQGNRGRLPAWVYERGRNGTDDGEAFDKWLANHGVPKSSAVMLDLEAAIDRPYVEDFHEELPDYTVLLYGSLSTLFANPETDGWFPADWTGHPHLFAHRLVLGTQYAAAQLRQTAGPWDMDLISPAVRLWQPGDWSPLREVITSGVHSLAHIADAHHTEPSTILRETLAQEKDGQFPGRLAHYINERDLNRHMPAGIRLWYRDGS